MRKYVDTGKQVIYFYDVPILDFDPRACIKRAGIASSTTNRDCSMAAADYRKSIQAHNGIVASVLKDFPMVSTFSPAAYLCNATRCMGMIDKKLMYRDNNHLTYDGDLYIGTKFAQEQKEKTLVRN